MRRRLAAPDDETMRAALLAYDVMRGRVVGAPYEPTWAPTLQRTATAGGNVFYRRFRREELVSP